MFAFTEFRRNITVSVIKYIRKSPYTEPFLKPKFKARIRTVKSRHHMQITDYSNSFSLALTPIYIHSLRRKPKYPRKQVSHSESGMSELYSEPTILTPMVTITLVTTPNISPMYVPLFLIRQIFLTFVEY